MIILPVIVDLSDRSNFSPLSLSFLLFTNFRLLPLYSRNFCMSPLTALHPMKRQMTSENCQCFDHAPEQVQWMFYSDL